MKKSIYSWLIIYLSLGNHAIAIIVKAPEKYESLKSALANVIKDVNQLSDAGWIEVDGKKFFLEEITRYENWTIQHVGSYSCKIKGVMIESKHTNLVRSFTFTTWCPLLICVNNFANEFFCGSFSWCLGMLQANCKNSCVYCKR